MPPDWKNSWRITRAKAARFAVVVSTRARQAAQAVPWGAVLRWGGGAVAAFVVALVLLIAFADWNALRGPAARVASALTGRPIAITGALDVQPWSFHPRVTVSGLRIGDPNWALRQRIAWARDAIPFAQIERASVEIELAPLLLGRVTLRAVRLDHVTLHLVRDAEGRANWSAHASDEAATRPLELPLIKRFVIRRSRVDFNDARRNMRLTADLFSDERYGRPDQPAFRLNGRGALNGKLFRLEMTGGALVNVRRDRPYIFHADLRAGDTHVQAGGVLDKPFDFGAYHANVRASGADLADLYYIIGVSLPNTPPYRLDGVLKREKTKYRIERIVGRVGDSDLRGVLSVRTDRPRLFVDANFVSHSLDFDDLAAVLGAPPATSRGEAASAEQRNAAQRLAAQGRLLPDAKLDLHRVRNMDARLVYRADRVVDAPVRLRAAALDLTLEGGVLTMDPVRLDLQQGDVGGLVRIDARADTPVVDLDLRLRGARLESFIPVENAVSGPLSGRVQLHGRGAAVRDVAATAAGAVTFVVPHGRIRKAFAELTGVNVTRGLGLLWSDDRSTANVRCGVADFRVRAGVAHARAIVFDTEDVLITGEGAVDLRDESLHLSVRGRAKEPRLVRLLAPIEIGGRLRAPRVGLDAGAAIGQAGAAGLLASLVAPLALILPFVDAGLADDANCAALLRGSPAERAQSAASAREG